VSVKALSIIVVLVLFLLPTAFMVFHVVYKLLTTGVRGMDSLMKPSPGLEKFRAKHKMPFYLLIASYLTVFFAAILWMAYEVLMPNLKIDSIISLTYIWFGTTIIVELVIIVYFMRRHMRRILQRLQPRPEPGSPYKTVLEWQNKYMDDVGNHMFDRDIIQMFLIILGVILVFAAIFIVLLLFVYT
jgi:hypothetical protein